MKISMVYDLVRWEEKALLKAGQDRGMEINMVDVKDMDMDLDAPLPGEYGSVTLQRCTSYYRGLHSTAYLEFKGQKVINDFNTIDVAGNKMLTSLALVKNGVPTPKTSVAASYDTAMKQFSSKFGGRAVLKPVTGSWGRMVALLNDRTAASAVMEDREYMYPLYSIFYLTSRVIAAFEGVMLSASPALMDVSAAETLENSLFFPSLSLTEFQASTADSTALWPSHGALACTCPDLNSKSRRMRPR